MKVTIVSSDKDLMQLVSDNVSMLDTMKGKVFKKEDVFDKFGVYPEKVIDVQSLAGELSIIFQEYQELELKQLLY